MFVDFRVQVHVPAGIENKTLFFVCPYLQPSIFCIPLTSNPDTHRKIRIKIVHNMAPYATPDLFSGTCFGGTSVVPNDTNMNRASHEMHKQQYYILGARIWDLGAQIDDLGIRICELGARIYDWGAQIMDSGPRLRDLGAQIIDSGAIINDLVPKS